MPTWLIKRRVASFEVVTPSLSGQHDRMPVVLKEVDCISPPGERDSWGRGERRPDPGVARCRRSARERQRSCSVEHVGLGGRDVAIQRLEM